jgi:hypothetical protein
MPPAGFKYKDHPNSCQRLPKTVARQMAFLRAYAAGPTAGHITRSTKAAHTTIESHYRWLDTDPIYVELFKKARRISAHVLEDEIHDRGVVGELKPVGFYQGKPGEWVREKSDILLLSAIGAKAPELGYNYRMNKMEVTGANGGPIELNVTAQPIPLHKLSLDAQKEILAILERELGSDEVKALNPAPEDVPDYSSDIEAIFGSDLESDNNRVSRQIWDINDLILLT